MTPLYAELNRWRALPFVWGELDCILALADWCMVAGWPDPAVDVRFAYDDRASCQRETRFITDPMGLMGRCLADIGMPRVAEAVEGDIAVLRLGRHVHVGAVWSAYGWASKADPGVVFHAPQNEVLRIWGVGYAA